MLAITIDEAYTYNTYVSAGFDGVFFFAYDANNHLIHTVLVWLSTALFGVSEWALRLPALLGTACYLCLLIRVLERTVSGSGMQRLAYAVLVLNPLALDLFCLARGYSIALAFLAAALCCLFRYAEGQNPRELTLLSVALGLCCVTNLSFAFPAIAILLVASLMVANRGQWSGLVSLLLPAGAIFGILMMFPLSHADRTSLYWGASTIRESADTTTNAFVLHEPGDFGPLATPRMRGRFVRRFLPGTLLLIVAAAAVQLYRSGLFHARTILWSVLLVTLFGYWLAHEWLGVLYPRERTGLALILLFFTSATALASECLGHRWMRWGITFPSAMIFGALLVQFAWQQRDLTHTWVWYQDKDNKLIADLLRQRKAKSISAYWLFQPPIEFYRRSGRLPDASALVRHLAERPPLAGHDAYVILNANPILLAANRLESIWANPATGITVAVPAGSR